MMEEDSSDPMDISPPSIPANILSHQDNFGVGPPKLDTTEFEEISASQVPAVSELPDFSRGTIQEFPVTMGFPSISAPAPLPNFATSQIDVNVSVMEGSTMPSIAAPVSTSGAVALGTESLSKEPQSDVQKDNGGNENETSLFGWLKSSELMSRVVEKTKSSIENVLTTVDPGMREYLHSGGDIHIIVASSSENKIGGFRDAFQSVFGHATVTGEDSQSGMVVQPVGFDSAYKACMERIKNLKSKVNPDSYSALAAVENCLVEMLPQQWFDIGCLVLHDSVNNIDLTTFTAPVPLPERSIQELQSKTDKSTSGFSLTIGEILQSLSLCSDRREWHLQLIGISRRSIICQAASVLANQYRSRVGYRIRGDSC